jgi:protein-L-isoaspartate(D-aspartate) O-methyltransferase
MSAGRWHPAALLAALLTVSGCPKREPRSDTGPAAREAEPTHADPGGEPSSKQPAAFAQRRAERRAFVKETIAERGVKDVRVLAAMRRVPRHAFVPESVRDMAYTDRPLPIGSGQTISQPYIVAYMTEAVHPKASDKCLEIGTGSGYQAAVLAELCQKTWSIEYLADVAEQGKTNLRALGYGPDRVQLRVGDGYAGWKEAAPFDVILVTAAPESVPKPLLEQLAVGGRLVIPVGPQAGAQELALWTRKRPGAGNDAFEVEKLLPVRFVPFLGEGQDQQ